MWKFEKNSFTRSGKGIAFTPEELEETEDDVCNPARGWYTIFPFPIEKPINPEELKWCLREQESVALVQFDLGAYREKPLDFFALNNCKEILNFFKQHKKDVILRPVYDLEGKGIEKEPETINLILKHLEQLGELLQMTDHSVYLFQGLLTGSWGEMHSSRYMSHQDTKRLYDCIKKYLGDEIYLSVRTPAIWRTLMDKSCYKAQEYNNVGLFHDAMFSSASDMGTYGTMTKEAAGWHAQWNRMEEIRFMSRINEKIPYGGEVLKGEIRSVKSMIDEMDRLHVSYLNHTYDKNRIDEWKQEAWGINDGNKGKSCYDYISTHLGYRYVVRNPRLKAVQRWKRKMKIEFEIENVGFGACCQNTELEVSVKSGQTIYKEILDINLKEWNSGEKKKVTVYIPIMKGRIFVAAYRKKDKRQILFANKNSESLLLGILS